MKADPAAQLKLLDLQELDSRIDTLRHRLRTIPEAAELAGLEAKRQELEGTVRDLQIQVSDLTREQSRADADVEQVKTRQQRDQSMIDAGAVKDPKALERMLGELESLKRRISVLEDAEIEVMERLEAAQQQLDAHQRELDALDDDRTTLEAARATKAADLEKELAEHTGERAGLVAAVPADLLSLYEKLRVQRGGVGAGALRRKECGGCGLSLNSVDLGRIAKAPADEVIRCEECDRILVRTAESGL